jgi:hypothetical protein
LGGGWLFNGSSNSNATPGTEASGHVLARHPGESRDPFAVVFACDFSARN